MNWTINRRIWTGFAFILFLLLIISVVGYRALVDSSSMYEKAIAEQRAETKTVRDRLEVSGSSNAAEAEEFDSLEVQVEKQVQEAHDHDVLAEKEIVVGTIVALLVGLFAAYWISRSVNKALNETAGVLASSATEILAATTEQASGASESMAAVAETAA